MRLCPAVLLTPLGCAVPISILYSKHRPPVNSLESALTSYSQLTENTATLSPAESALTQLSPATPLECALTKNMGGGDLSIPIQNRPLAALLKFFLFTSLRTLLRFFALRKNSTLFFSIVSALFRKKHRGVGYPFLLSSRLAPREAT
jgi:hypothetical protein